MPQDTPSSHRGSAGKIAHLGSPGSYSHEACLKFAPHLEPVGFLTFKEVIQAIEKDPEMRGMIPIENSFVGRVQDIYALLPTSKVSIETEFFLPIVHNLLAKPGSNVSALRTARGHPMALAQCRSAIERLNLTKIIDSDTGSACQYVAENSDGTMAAIGSLAAAQHYGLDVIEEAIQDSDGNKTRFLQIREGKFIQPPTDDVFITTMVFEVRSIPSALYKCLGGFATNGINLTKLESYYVGDNFRVAKFYCDFEGHPEHTNVKNAIEEIGFYSKNLIILGTYPANPLRNEFKTDNG
ncbi:MAG: prephenate dehydratase domain-containing protein [Pseudomonadota bacterium]